MKTASRPKVDDRMVMAVAHRLTERDRSILTMIYRHRVFTTDQLAEMFFDNINTAQHRLTTLYQLRLVERFQPIDRRYVSQPYHYVLDQLGAMVVAAEADKDPDKTHWQQERALAIGRSQRLAHLVGTNGFFSALLGEGRRRDDCGLSLWWSERYCASNFNEIARPDGLGIWEEGGAKITFCLEYDRSTETLERLEKKLRSYEDLQIASGYAYWVLFCFGHPRREAGARRALAQSTVPVATAALGPTQRPHEAVWAPIGYGGCRMHLAELAGVPHPPESYRRIEETTEHRRRIDEQRRRDYPDRHGEA
jgi:predicted transcriptional regulator